MHQQREGQGYSVGPDGTWLRSQPHQHDTPPAPCPSLGRCTYPNCGHFLDVTRASSAVPSGVASGSTVGDGGQHDER